MRLLYIHINKNSVESTAHEDCQFLAYANIKPNNIGVVEFVTVLSLIRNIYSVIDIEHLLYLLFISIFVKSIIFLYSYQISLSQHAQSAGAVEYADCIFSVER